MSESAKTQEMLRQQLVTFRQILDNVPEAIVLLDREGKRIWQNNAYSVILKLAPENLQTSTSLAEIHPDDLPTVVETLRGVLSGGNSLKVPFRSKQGDGRWADLLLDAFPHRSQSGAVTGIICLLSPTRIHGKPHIILEELRPLVSSLLTHLSLAALHPSPNVESAANLRDALLVAQDLHAVANPQSAVTGTRSIPLIRPTLVVTALILQELDELMIQPSGIARTKFNLTATTAAVTGNGRALRTLFQEIIKNALEAMDRGVIEIEQRLHTVSPGDPLASRKVAPGLYVGIHFRDQGCGMSEIVRNRVFEPSYTTKEGHAGMGLTRAMEIARACGGTILIHSQDRASTLVSVYLPVANPDQLSADIKTKTPDGDASRKLRVLLMDDEPFVREFAAAMLESLGYDVVATAEGTEAMAEFSRATMDNEPFDIVLLDLIVPNGVSGESTLSALRSMRDDFVAIATSGHADHPVMKRPQGYGFSACLPKPFKMEDLEARMNKARDMILGTPPV